MISLKIKDEEVFIFDDDSYIEYEDIGIRILTTYGYEFIPYTNITNIWGRNKDEYIEINCKEYWG